MTKNKTFKKYLFITRKYPPIVGGMENLSYEITTRIKKKRKSIIIANKKTNKFLPIFIFISLFKSFYTMLTKKIDIIHLGDPVMSPVGLILKMFFRKKVFVEIHGLDVIFKNKFYQWFFIKIMLMRCDGYICISEKAKEELIKRGAKNEKCVVIPIGIDNAYIKTNETKEISRKKLSEQIGQSLENKEIIITVGRLVQRKGVKWFVNNVLPHLPQNIIYLIIGDGEEKENIAESIKTKNMSQRAILLGRVSDEMLKTIYNAADLFIMPNIKVKGDMEGFGIVAIEASSLGIPVIATGIEGIKDAIIDKSNGILLEELDAKAYIKTIKLFPRNTEKYKAFSKQCKKFTLKHNAWDRIINQYLEFMEI